MRPVEFHEKIDGHLRGDGKGPVLVGVARDLLIGATVEGRGSDNAKGIVLLASNRTNQPRCLKFTGEVLPPDDQAHPPRAWGVEIVAGRAQMTDLVGQLSVSAFSNLGTMAHSQQGQPMLVLRLEVPVETSDQPPMINTVPVELDAAWYAALDAPADASE